MSVRQDADAGAFRSRHGRQQLGRHRALGRYCRLGWGGKGAQTRASEKVQIVTLLVCKSATPASLTSRNTTGEGRGEAARASLNHFPQILVLPEEAHELAGWFPDSAKIQPHG